jgi:hypothetical protein
VRRHPRISAAASAEALRGVQDGLAAAADAVPPAPSGQLRLPRLTVRLRPGAGPSEIAEAVRRAVAEAIVAALG